MTEVISLEGCEEYSLETKGNPSPTVTFLLLDKYKSEWLINGTKLDIRKNALPLPTAEERQEKEVRSEL